jgi:bifunctional DNA-binding transcriptional regulator/antitoxin component of YhaV-PrlF toxin-antitoxin module
MISAMTTTIAAGEMITVPQEVLDEAGLEPGTPVEITVRDGHIEIGPVWRKVRFEKHGHVMVAVPVEPVEEKLTNERVNEMIEQIRDERMNEMIGEVPRESFDRRR